MEILWFRLLCYNVTLTEIRSGEMACGGNDIRGSGGGVAVDDVNSRFLFIRPLLKFWDTPTSGSIEWRLCRPRGAYLLSSEVFPVFRFNGLYPTTNVSSPLGMAHFISNCIKFWSVSLAWGDFYAGQRYCGYSFKLWYWISRLSIDWNKEGVNVDKCVHFGSDQWENWNTFDSDIWPLGMGWIGMKSGEVTKSEMIWCERQVLKIWDFWSLAPHYVDSCLFYFGGAWKSDTSFKVARREWSIANMCLSHSSKSLKQSQQSQVNDSKC